MAEVKEREHATSQNPSVEVAGTKVTLPGGSATEIPLALIRENPAALRSVDKEREEYIELVDSVRARGVMQPILVRRMVDPESKQEFYSLIDGLHRYSAAQDAGRQTIPVFIQSMEDAQALEAQIILNATKIETRPVEYSKALERLMGMNPLLTTAELAGRLAKSISWLNERLHLTKLAEPIGKLVDEGKINLSNAYALAKLPPEEQASFLDRAISMTPAEFAPTCQARAKELREAKRAGRAAAGHEFQPVAFLQKLVDVRNEYEQPVIGPYLVKELKITDPIEAFKQGIAWTLHMDPKSIEAQKQKDDQRKKENEEAKEKRKKENEIKRAKDAAEKAEQARAELTRMQAAK